LAAIVGAVIANMVNDVDEDSDDGESVTKGLRLLFGVTALASICLATVALAVASLCFSQMIKTGLVFSVAMGLVIAVLGFVDGQILIGCLGILCFLVGCCYAVAVWSRIPFADAVLDTALAAVKANCGVGMVAYLMVGVAYLWSTFWFMGFGDAIYGRNYWLLFGLLISYYWVLNILFNVVVVTTIGTVGTWWMAPEEASSCCSSGVRESFQRATTYSFGSICVGSLLVALVQALRAINSMIQASNDSCQLLSCICGCIMGCIQGTIEYMNKWSYTFVGLYGFGYVESGRAVFELFASRGWSSVVSDDLIDRVLDMISVGVGLATGLVAVAFSSVDDKLLNIFDLGENEKVSAFFIGLAVGYAFCTILMSVIGAAVNAVIVCFADSAAEFESNHPELSAQMREAWVRAWPDHELPK
jgi:Plasma-membrane choline transporter